MSNVSAAENVTAAAALTWAPQGSFQGNQGNIKAITRVVTNFSTKGTKVVIKGGSKAREKDTRVAVNGVTMAQTVVVANQL